MFYKNWHQTVTQETSNCNFLKHVSREKICLRVVSKGFNVSLQENDQENRNDSRQQQLAIAVDNYKLPVQLQRL